MSNTLANQVHKSEIEILWKLESAHSQNSESVLWYVDFRIDSIDGVFRVANSDGVDLTDLLDKVLPNQDFFRHVVDTGVSNVFEESHTSPNSHNGWEWKETFHPKLVSWCLLGTATSWFTCPFGGKRPEVQSMHKLYNIQSSGVELLHSWHRNRQPSRVCYFFPNQSNV